MKYLLIFCMYNYVQNPQVLITTLVVYKFYIKLGFLAFEKILKFLIKYFSF